MMHRLGFGAWGGILCVPLLLACSFGRADMVRRDAYGGVLALKGAQAHAMEDAEQQMALHCGSGNYAVVQEEQVVVGQQTQTVGGSDSKRKRRKGGSRGRERHHATTTTRDLTEYRITYQCGTGGTAEAPRAAPRPATAGGAEPAPTPPKPDAPSGADRSAQQ